MRSICPTTWTCPTSSSHEAELSDYPHGAHSAGIDRDAAGAAGIVGALGRVRSRIVTACLDAGRDPRTVTLVAVTKTRPVSDVAALVRLGVRDIGENRDQEARAKIAGLLADSDRKLPDSPDDPALRWHLVGTLQTNKARSVAAYAHAVHSADRAKIIAALGRAAADRDRTLEVFVQLSLDGDPQRGGADPDELPVLADAVAAEPALRLAGVMAVPPMDAEPDASFARLRELSERLRADHPGAGAISAGMSADLEAAIRHGSTHVRVGTALLGRREQSFS